MFLLRLGEKSLYLPRNANKTPVRLFPKIDNTLPQRCQSLAVDSHLVEEFVLVFRREAAYILVEIRIANLLVDHTWLFSFISPHVKILVSIRIEDRPETSAALLASCPSGRRLHLRRSGRDDGLIHNRRRKLRG